MYIVWPWLKMGYNIKNTITNKAMYTKILPMDELNSTRGSNEHIIIIAWTQLEKQLS